MSRSSRKSAQAVSLFPFLAVLICAMGTLIFLLIVTTQKIRKDAIAKVEVKAEAAPEVEPVLVPDAPEPEVVEIEVPEKPIEIDEPAVVDNSLDELIIERRRQAAILQKQLDQQQALLSRRQRELSLLEGKLSSVPAEFRSQAEHIKQLKQSASQLQASLEQKKVELASIKDQKSKDVETYRLLKMEQGELKSKIDEKSAQLSQLQKRQNNAQGKFAIIPYDGRLGTTRRPILIECSARGIRFIPEDIVLTSDDVEGFTRAFNPLLAGTDALADYWMKQAVKTDSPQTHPYVLLLVRPDGAAAFYAARKFLSRLEHSYGYELIEESWELDLPAVDQQARSECQTAINQVLAQRSAVIDAYTETKLGANRGFVFRGRTNRVEEFPARPGYTPPDEEEESQQEGFPGRFGNIDEGDERTTARHGRGSGDPSNVFQSPGSERNNQSYSGVRKPGGNRLGENVGSQPNQDASIPSVNGRLKRNELNSIFGNTGSNQRGNLGPIAPEAGQRGMYGRNPFESSGSEGITTAQPSELNGPTPNGTPGDANSSLFPQTANRSGGDSVSKSDESVTGNSESNGNSKSESLAGNSSGQPGKSGTQSSTAANNGTSNSAPAGMQPTNNAGNPLVPSFVLGQQQKKQKSVKTFADESILNALQQKRTRTAIGFERDIQITISDQYIVVENLATVRLKQSTIDESTAQSVVKAVVKHVSTWGEPPQGFYWIPAIKLENRSNVAIDFQILKKSLKKAGAYFVDEVGTSRRRQLTTSPSTTRRR